MTSERTTGHLPSPDEPLQRGMEGSETHPVNRAGVKGRTGAATTAGIATAPMAAIAGAIPDAVERGAAHVPWAPIRQRLRRRRDLRTVEVFGIKQSDVERLDGASLGQLATWVRLPGVWGVMTFAYVYSAIIIGGLVAVRRRAGWWPEADGSLFVAGAFIAWGVLALPLLAVFTAFVNRIDTSLDPFLPFGRAGSGAVRALTTPRRSQLRRRTLALACLREWHSQGKRLGLNVEERFQRATAPLGTTRDITDIAAAVRSEVIPLLVTTAHGTFNTDQFPDRKRATPSRSTLIKAALGIVGAPTVAALIQIIAEILT